MTRSFTKAKQREQQCPPQQSRQPGIDRIKASLFIISILMAQYRQRKCSQFQKVVYDYTLPNERSETKGHDLYAIGASGGRFLWNFVAEVGSKFHSTAVQFDLRRARRMFS